MDYTRGRDGASHWWYNHLISHRKNNLSTPTAKRECRTIKEFVWELPDKGGACRISLSQGSCLRTWDCVAVQVGWEVTVGVTVHDGMSDLRQKGAGDGHLRCELREIFGTIYRQERIGGPELGGIVEFEFKRLYKTLGSSHKTTLVHLRFEQMIRAQSVECQAIFKPQSL